MLIVHRNIELLGQFALTQVKAGRDDGWNLRTAAAEGFDTSLQLQAILSDRWGMLLLPLIDVSKNRNIGALARPGLIHY